MEDKWKTNPFAKKYKAKNSAHEKALKHKVGTKDEYPKKFRNAFVEAVGIYNKNHPD